jgi:6-phosphogluconolactonase
MDREVIRTWNFVADAANFIVDQANKAISERKEFRIGLSGGNTPRPIYERLAIIRRDLPWESVPDHLWGRALRLTR